MKLTRLICVIALAAAVGACGNDDNGSGGDGGTGGTAGAGGTGGTAGTGATGGTVTDACTNDTDIGVIEMAGGGDFDAGRVVVSDFAADCIRTECTSELGDVINTGGADEEANQALATCVEVCTAEMYQLTPQCLSCYGGSVSCGSANCTAECVADVNSPECTNCRCNVPDSGNTNGVDCVELFETCAGIDSTVMCP